MTTYNTKRLEAIQRRRPSRAQLQRRVHQFLTQLNCTMPNVEVEIITDDNILASALGVTFGSVSFGKIKVSRNLLGLLTDAEVDFVLAHEVAHIHFNHIITTGSLVAIRGLAEEAAMSEPTLKNWLAIWDIIKVAMYGAGRLPPSAVAVKKQELDADALAVLLTRNKAAAFSALRKLVGNKLSAPSHTWEVFGAYLPVMTVRERLSTLNARLPV